VIDTLEASFWSIFNNNDFKDSVLCAVNLGYDADTVGAITGALAGIIYGHDSIPEEWLNVLARKEDIIELANKLDSATKSNP
jgi:ADP-ribosyl-[dinitrogen reductase] hydrolase